MDGDLEKANISVILRRLAVASESFGAMESIIHGMLRPLIMIMAEYTGYYFFLLFNSVKLMYIIVVTSMAVAEALSSTGNWPAAFRFYKNGFFLLVP